MNAYQEGRMRRKELERRRQTEMAEVGGARAQRRRMTLIVASIAVAVAAILVIAPMRFRAIAGNDRDEVETYLMENIDEALVEAGYVTEGGAADARPDDDASGLMLLAESLSNAEEDPVKTTDKTILTKYLLVDSEFAHEGMQFGDVYSDEDLVANAVISQYMNEMPLLDPGEDSPYYVAMLDTTQFSGCGTVIDADFARANTLGQVIDDATYDREKGIAYVPKYLFDGHESEVADGILPVQAQLLVSYDLSAQTTGRATVTVPLTVTSERPDARPAGATEFVASAFDTSVTIPVVVPEDAANVTKANLLVCLGGSDFPMELGDENSSYDSETGELTVAMNAMTLTSISVTVTADDVVSTFVDAVTRPGEASAVSPDSMVTWPNGALSNLDMDSFDKAVSGKTVYSYDSKVLRFSSGYDFSNLDAEDKAFQSAAVAASRYVYGGDSVAKNNEIVADVVQGDGYSEVVGDNGATQKSGGRGYYWQEGGGINEAFAFPGCTGVPATVSTAKRGTAYALDLSGLRSLTDPDATDYLVGAGLCSHIESSNEASPADQGILNNVDATLHVQDAYVIMRPLYRDAGGQYVIIAFIGARLSTQSGVGVYKFRVRQPGYAKVEKASGDASITDGNASYSLAGARYDLYASEEHARSGQNSVGTLVTGADGVSDAIPVRAGRYWARETSAPMGYALDDGILGPCDVDEGQTVTFHATDAPQKGTVSVMKQDSETKRELASGAYTMTLYAADKRTALKSVTIAKAEPASFGSYGYGTYYVHEESATYPYMTEEFGVSAATAWHEVTIDAQTPEATVTVYDSQRRGEIALSKVDEGGQPVGGATFVLYAGQDVTSYDGTPRHVRGQPIPVKEISSGNYAFDPSSPACETVTDAQGRIKVSGLYLTGDDTVFRLVEQRPAPGFVLDQTPVTFALRKDEGKKVITDAQGKVNRGNAIKVYAFEETVPTQDSQDPGKAGDPDEPGDPRNVPIANKVVGVWKAEDDLRIELADGKDAIAVRTPSGDAQYRPTFVPIGRGATLRLTWPADVPMPHLVSKETGEDIEARDQMTLVPGQYDAYVPYGSDRVWLTGEASRSKFDKLQAHANGAITATLAGDPKVTDVKWDVLNEAELIRKGADYDLGELYNRGDLKNVVAEWNGELSAWVATGIEPSATYKVLIASKNVATITGTLNAGGQVLYGRYAFEESEFFSKGWIDQAGLPKDDSKYVIRGLTNAERGLFSASRVAPGDYLLAEIKPPADATGNYTWLVDRKIHTFTVNEGSGLVRDTDDVSFGHHTADSGAEAQEKAFVIREQRTHLLLHKRSSETGKDVTGAQLVLTNEEHTVVDQWTSDGKAHSIDGLRAGTYYMSEVVTPQNYDKATTVTVTLKATSTPQTVVMYDAPLVVGVTVDKRQEIADPLDSRHMENGDGKNTANLSSDKFGFFNYALDARSTSNSWIDELTFTDEPKSVADGLARVVSVTTPQAWQDYDGKMNVWYKTNKTPADYVDPSGANATVSDGHSNAWLAMRGASGLDADGDKRVEDYRGWRLWRSGIPTMVATTLEVGDLGLADGELVTGVRFEYGRVEMGFTTRPTDWNRELLKNPHDDVDAVLGADRLTFDAADAAADAAISKLDTIVSSFSTDASRAAESVIAQRTRDEEVAYRRLIAEIEEYNSKLAPDSELPRKFLEAPETPAYQGGDNAVTKLNAAREAAKASIRAVFETSDTPEGRIALSQAIPGLKSLVAGSASDDTATMVEGKVNDLIVAIGNADADAIAAVQQSLIGDLDTAVDEIVDTGLAGRVHYSPAIVRMQVTDRYVAGTSLGNSASAVAARNGGLTTDSDAGTQTPKGTSDPKRATTPANPTDAPADPDGTPAEAGFDDTPMASRDEDESFQSAKLRVIEMETSFALPDGSKEITVESGEMEAVDRVNLTGLTPGKEYVLLGEIHTRMGTEDEGFVDAGVVYGNMNEPITSMVTFTPTSDSSYVDVPFAIDVERLDAYPAVAFEELHESVNGQPGEAVLAEHKDISDAEQTLELNPTEFDAIDALPEPARRLFRKTKLAQTGDMATIAGIVAVSALAVATVVVWRRRRGV